MNSLVIKNGVFITPDQIIEEALLAVNNGVITYFGNEDRFIYPSKSKVIDAKDCYITPGLIDIHVNGGEGSDVLDASEEALKNITSFHAKHGTTSMVPTLVSTSKEKIIKVLSLLKPYVDNTSLGVRILGAHIEGPFISPQQIGAHNPRYLRKPSSEEIDELIEYSGSIKIITAAPEVDGVIELFMRLNKKGIITSIGHSDATYDEVIEAVENGFSLFTHIYSSMSSLKRVNLKKVAGVLEAALSFDELPVEVIGDGVHVPRQLLKLIIKAKGFDKIILITDAIRAAGMEDGEYILGDEEYNHKIIVENKVARTLDASSYAGSTATMNICVKNMIDLGKASIQNAVKTATVNPAKLLKIENKVGRLEIGMRADIAVFDKNFKTIATIVDGVPVYLKDNIKNSIPNIKTRKPELTYAKNTKR